MPKVGNKMFAYTKAGEKKAKAYAKKTNKKMTTTKKSSKKKMGY